MILKNKKKIIFFNLIFISIIFILDRISKIYVISQYKKNFENILFESKFLNIHLIWNDGIAFGLLSFGEKNLYNILTLVIILAKMHSAIEVINEKIKGLFDLYNKDKDK